VSAIVLSLVVVVSVVMVMMVLPVSGSLVCDPVQRS
jgi:hypothetical protein